MFLYNLLYWFNRQLTIYTMKIRNHFTLLSLACALLVLCSACGGRTTSNKNKPAPFEIPEIPMMLSPQDRGAFLAQHYWDKFDFTDTVYQWGNEAAAEQIFANYIAIMWQVELDKATSSIKKFLATAEAAENITFTRFLDLCEKYLYDPNSPMRNEELYIPVLEYIVVSPNVPELEKIRPLHRLEMAFKNRVGAQATDFTYTLASGVKGNLYNIRADYTILFFNNPGCSACKSMREEISSLPLLSEMINSGQIKVLAVYPDEDLAEWKDYQPNIPTTWINAYDENQVMKKENTYDFKAIPALYLLSHDKYVLIKDALSPIQLEQYLASL